MKKSICETCGSQGWKGLFVACSKCGISCEHRYCMQEYSLETSIDFVCAGCSMRPVQKSFASGSSKAVPRNYRNEARFENHRNKARVESSNPVPKWKKIPETSKMKLISPEEVRKLSSGGNNKSTFKVPRPVPVRSAMGLTRQTVCFPRARSMNSSVVARKTNPIPLPPKKLEPPTSPRSLQISSGVERQASKAQAVGEGSKPKVGDRGKDSGSKEICRSILSEQLLQLLPYRPAFRPTWKGRIVDSSTPSEFDGDFLGQLASKIHAKAYRLSKMVPVLLSVALRPIGSHLNDMFANRSPSLSDVEIYIFPDGKNTKRFKEEHARLFEAMRTRNAMIRINIKGTPLLLFSSKLLDKSSQLIIKMQKKTNNFLWGIFLVTKKSLALVPGSSSQAAQRFDDGVVVDNDTKPQFRHSNHRNSGKELQRH